MADLIARGLAKQAKNSDMMPSLLLQNMKRAKGGLIGTDGKGAIAIRFDDWQDSFRTNIYPLLQARGLPASMALISRFNTAQPWGAGTTWDNIRTWNRNGVEMWSHGTNHNDPSPDGYAGLEREIVTSKQEIEAQGIRCLGFALPGATPLTSEVPYNGLTNIQEFNSDAGKLIYNNYAISEAYAGGVIRTLPTNMYHGLDHITISDGATLASSKAWVDYVVKRKVGAEFMIHAGNIGQGTNMTLAEITSFFDYIVEKWEGGSIEVLTPSGLFFADPSSSHRLELLINGGFEGVSPASPGEWNTTPSWTGKTVPTSGGRNNSSYLSIDSATGNFVTQRIGELQQMGVGGEQFIFEGWFRSNGAANTIGRVIIQDYLDLTRLNLNITKQSDGTNWTKMKFILGLHPLTDKLTVGLARNSGDGIDWDDVSIKKI